MKELTKVFGDTPLEIKMIDDESFYVNVSGIAKQHKKNITEWKKGKNVHGYIEALEKSNNLSETEMIRQVGNTTLIHNKLLVIFARWLSPTFGVWCDNLIYELIADNKTETVEIEDIMGFAERNKKGFLKDKLIPTHFRADPKSRRAFVERELFIIEEKAKGFWNDLYDDMIVAYREELTEIRREEEMRLLKKRTSKKISKKKKKLLK